MAEKLEDRINNIINDRSFNDLPFEQRKFICKFLQQHQILTLLKIGDVVDECFEKKH